MKVTQPSGANDRLSTRANMEQRRRAAVALAEYPDMATRERRLAEFNGEGDPAPDQVVQVLCEDHSGTYQLPFPCKFVDGAWRNADSDSAVEASVVGWRLPRFG
jgi:hypothetical protein